MKKSSDFNEIVYTAAVLDECHVIKKEKKVALDRLRVRQNVAYFLFRNFFSNTRSCYKYNIDRELLWLSVCSKMITANIFWRFLNKLTARPTADGSLRLYNLLSLSCLMLILPLCILWLSFLISITIKTLYFPWCYHTAKEHDGRKFNCSLNQNIRSSIKAMPDGFLDQA